MSWLWAADTTAAQAEQPSNPSKSHFFPSEWAWERCVCVSCLSTCAPLARIRSPSIPFIGCVTETRLRSPHLTARRMPTSHHRLTILRQLHCNFHRWWLIDILLNTQNIQHKLILNTSRCVCECVLVPFRVFRWFSSFSIVCSTCGPSSSLVACVCDSLDVTNQLQ